MQTSNDTETSNIKSHDCSNKIKHDEEERLYFEKVIEAFKHYGDYCREKIHRSIRTFNELSDKHKQLIPDFDKNCAILLKCIKHNCTVINLIINNSENVFENEHMMTNVDGINFTQKTQNNDIKKIIKLKRLDIDRIVTTLKQITRDWSSEGYSERNSCYGALIEDVKYLYPKTNFNPNEISILVPGAGLGRLAFEIANLGFKCQGNEFSLEMLLTSNFILNQCKSINSYFIYPWINEWCNNLKFDDQIRAIKFPDISPFDLPITSQFSMAAGDFLEVYSTENEWDCVVTCYFIDTARNIIEYLEKILFILVPGGYWANFGPLLYHFSDSHIEKSIELSYEQLKTIIEKLGFKFIKEEFRCKSTYNENQKSMLKYVYDCVHFIVQKPSS